MGFRISLNLWSISYNLFGGFIRRWLKYFSDLGESILKARIKRSLEVYVSFLVLMTLISFIVSFIAGFIYMSYAIKFPSYLSILIALGIALLSSATTFAGIYMYPSLKASAFASRIDADLPYAIAHMNVMASAGATPEDIFRSVASVPGDAVGEFMTDMIRDIDLLGMDLVTAIRRARDRAPSKTLESFLSEMEAIITSGGNLPDFLSSYGREILGTKAIEAKEFSETLGTLAEVFIIMMVVFPLLMIVMLSIMSLVGGTIMGMSLSMLMWLITYVLVPMLGIMFLVMLDQVIPRGE